MALAAPSRDKRTERTRRRQRQVLDAAASLMEAVGFHEMSMQTLAEKADLSVGLIYQYFGNKDDVLRAVIVDILEDFHREVPAAIEAAGDDPVARLSAALRTFCTVIDAKRDATILAYRESKTLSPEGRAQIKELEVRTTDPIREAVRDGMNAGTFRDAEIELVVHNLLMVAHGWALKHWHLVPGLSLDAYVTGETELLLTSLRPD